MTDAEALDWCSKRSLDLRLNREGDLSLKSSKPRRFFIAAPEEHRRVIVLVRHILCFAGETSFHGGMLWLRRWDIGSPQLVRVGWKILEGMRRGHGDSKPLDIAPAQMFRDDDLVEAHAFLVQVIAFGWVADYVPIGAKYFLHFKDNRQICFSSAAEPAKELHNAFQMWNPTDEDPMLVEMRRIEKARLTQRRKKR
jgi:hypothetical protein